MSARPANVPDGVITGLLHEIAHGVADAEDRLWQVVFHACLTIAHRELRQDRMRTILHPRDLVGLAFLKLAGDRMPPVPNRRAFYALAARAMRQALRDTAQKAVGKNGGRRTQELDPQRLGVLEQEQAWSLADILSLDEALVALAQVRPRLARVVELRFFSCLTIREIALELGTSPQAIRKQLGDSVAWLAGRFGEHP